MTPPNLKEFVNSISDYPDTYKGRGIVTSGGGLKWFPSLVRFIQTITISRL